MFKFCCKEPKNGKLFFAFLLQKGEKVQFFVENTQYETQILLKAPKSNTHYVKNGFLYGF